MKIKNVKKISILLLLTIIISMVSGMIFSNKSYANKESNKIDNILSITMDNMINNKDSFLDAWSIIGLARKETPDIDKISEKYLKNLNQQLKEKDGLLSDNKYSDYSKAVLALTSLGIDPGEFKGYNLLDNFKDMDKITLQGINGPTWALLALDSNDYTSSIPRETLINYILDNEINGGGWSLSSDKADVDITAMVLTSLSKYKDIDNVKPYIQRGIEFLSKVQKPDGGYETMSATNSESSSQVIIALTSLGIAPLTDTRFIKNGNTIIDNLIDNYFKKEGGFSHLKSGDINHIATEQGFSALVAYKRFKEGKTSLYNMTDIEISIEKSQVKEETKLENPFEDIENDTEKAAIIGLYNAGIIKGVSKTEFKPNDNISRAEFATILVRALDKEENQDYRFSDVEKTAWYSGYVGAAKKAGLINGYSDGTFKPLSNITREEGAMIIYNMAKISGFDVSMEEVELRNYLSQFPDYLEISNWSRDAMGFGVKNAYISNELIYIEPRIKATRSEVAGMIYRLLKDI